VLLFDLDVLRNIRPALGGSHLWRHAFHYSFALLNARAHRWHKVLDSGGGRGDLESIIKGDALYFLADLSHGRLKVSGAQLKTCANAERLPFRDDSFDLIVSISTFQYVDHDKFLSECRRTLTSGGILALHENGALNPIIRLVRIFRSVLALFSSKYRAYNQTIRGYLTPEALVVPGLEVIVCRPFYFLSAICWIVEWVRLPGLSRLLEHVLVPIDDLLLRAPLFRKLGFLNVFHLRKLPQRATSGLVNEASLNVNPIRGNMRRRSRSPSAHGLGPATHMPH
jgi:SAM-dependent methyltransferase